MSKAADLEHFTMPPPQDFSWNVDVNSNRIGQSLASTRRKSSALTRRSFHVPVSHVHPYATTHETPSALLGLRRRGVS
jgi:hypothetical protein